MGDAPFELPDTVQPALRGPARRLGRALLRLIAVLVLGVAGSALMVRLAPGFGVDERELDPRLSGESIQAVREENAQGADLWSFYRGYLAGLLRGDLGHSRVLNRDIATLFSERIPVTARSLALGLAGGWALGLLFALPAVLLRLAAVDMTLSVIAGFALCIPAAVFGLLFLFSGGPVSLALAVVVFPKVFRYARNLLKQAYAADHVLAARARGIGGMAVFFRHALPPASGPLLALAGVTVSTGFGAAVPIEVICDSPGIGQLAWQAAMGRDLPLLVGITALVTIVTLLANSVAEFFAAPQGAAS